MHCYRDVKRHLGSKVVCDVENAVTRAAVAAWSNDHEVGFDALESLLVFMLASVIASRDRAESQERSLKNADRLVRIAANLPG
jgi:hypothetical protein